jgi:hypothetical protein
MSPHAWNGGHNRVRTLIARNRKWRRDGLFDFLATFASPYDTPQRYTDTFRITGADGTVFGERILLNDHQNEKPVTRELTSVTNPAGVQRVVIEGRDQASGYGGKRLEVDLPGR